MLKMIIKGADLYITKKATNYHIWIGVVFMVLILFISLFCGYESDRMFYFQYLSILLSIFFFVKGVNLRSEKLFMANIALFNLLILFLFAIFDNIDIPVDTIRYQREAFQISNNKSFWGTLFHIMKSDNYIDNINDIGYLLSLSTCYLLFGEYWGNIAILVFKFVCHLLTCKIVYHLLIILLGRKSAKISTLLWGINLYSPYLMYSGLKENIFALFVALTILSFYKLIKEVSFLHVLFFALSVLTTYGFRASYPFYFISALALYWYLKEKPSKVVLSVTIGIILIATFGSVLILEFYPQANGLFRDREVKFDSKGFSFVFLNMINAFISPYPSVTAGNQNVNLVTAAYSVFHMSFALFALTGIYHVIKYKKKNMYPLLYVFIMNSAMLIAAGFSMNARYVYPIVFAYYAFIPFGIKEYFRMRIIMPYIALVVMLTFMYNNIR